MRQSIGRDAVKPIPLMPKGALACATALLLAMAAACAGPASSKPDAPAAKQGGAGGGGGTTTSAGGSGGTTISAGGSGGLGGAGGEGGGSGGTGGSGTGGSTPRDAGRDTGRGTGGAKDASSRTDTSSGNPMDGGAIACDDIESPGRLAVYYYSNSAASGSSIQMYFDVVNFTAFSSKLSQVTVRYWFTDEGASAPNVLEQYYVPLPTSMKFVKLDPPREGADTVLEVSFTGAGDAGGAFVETRGFNFAFHKKDYSGTYDQTNDYSYEPTLKTSLGQNPRITAYIAGERVWGCEPP
jgi:Cellulose binding domain